MARMLALRDETPDDRLEEVARIVRSHGVLAIPTESFYALAASPTDEEAVRRVCSIKGRGDGKPILVLVGAREQMRELAFGVGRVAQCLMDRFWPGPLTIVVPAAPGLPATLTAGTGTVGIRLVGLPALARLLRVVGPLTGTSANRTGQPPMRSAAEVQAQLGGELDLIVDSGPTPGGFPSTVVTTVGQVRVLREGPITSSQIEAALAEAGLGSLV
ncbi:L-threonylcarbamoyladenylate synthase [Nitrospira sp. Kam-Ns4a]